MDLDLYNLVLSKYISCIKWIYCSNSGLAVTDPGPDWVVRWSELEKYFSFLVHQTQFILYSYQYWAFIHLGSELIILNKVEVLYYLSLYHKSILKDSKFVKIWRTHVLPSDPIVCMHLSDIWIFHSQSHTFSPRTWLDKTKILWKTLRPLINSTFS